MDGSLARLGRSLSRRFRGGEPETSSATPPVAPVPVAPDPVDPVLIERQRQALEAQARGSGTFCAAPWVHFLTTPDGGVLPCCMGKKAILDDEGEGANVRRTDPAAIWNGSDFKRIRQALLDGETLPHCVTCLDYEAMGHTSYRKKFNAEYFGEEGGALRKSFLDRVPDPADPVTADKPIFFDIRLGNICNLKCRMCGPNLSSQIEKDKVATAWIDAKHTSIGANVDDWPEAYDLLGQLKDFVVDSIYLELIGGEPTLNQTHITMLEHLVDSGLSSGIDVLMISNLTNINDRIYELLSQFRNVTVQFSVEAVGPVNDYIRSPAKWAVTSKRLLDTRDRHPKIWFGISPTFQAYNALDITDLFDWCVANDLPFGTGNILLFPNWLSVLVLPQEIRTLAAERVRTWMERNPLEPGAASGLEAFISYLLDESKTATEEQIREFVVYTNDLDWTRNQSIRDSLPELYELLSRHRPWDHDLFRHRTLKIGHKARRDRAAAAEEADALTEA
ncbi:twitch domain-containing radical SAM protein [Brevundimonas sp.]